MLRREMYFVNPLFIRHLLLRLIFLRMDFCNERLILCRRKINRSNKFNCNCLDEKKLTRTIQSIQASAGCQIKIAENQQHDDKNNRIQNKYQFYFCNDRYDASKYQKSLKY